MTERVAGSVHQARFGGRNNRPLSFVAGVAAKDLKDTEESTFFNNVGLFIPGEKREVRPLQRASDSSKWKSASLQN